MNEKEKKIKRKKKLLIMHVNVSEKQCNRSQQIICALWYASKTFDSYGEKCVTALKFRKVKILFENHHDELQICKFISYHS